MSGSPGEFVELSLLKEARDQRAGELRGTTRPPARPQAGMLAEHVASPPTPTDFIESVLSAPEVRAAAARAAVEPKLETLRARIAAARRRLEAKQQEYGTKLNALAHRDYAKLHVLLGGSLAMELKDKVDEVRGVFEGRVRAGGTIVDPSVFATLDRTLRLIAEVKAQDLHRCPPPPPPCGCPVGRIIALIESAEAWPSAVVAGMDRIHHLEARIASALKARDIDGTEELPPPGASAPPITGRPSTQALSDFDPS
jgi:hypothetical protein